MKKTKIKQLKLVNKNIEFFEFYKLLTKNLNSSGCLSNILVSKCTIYRIPKNYLIVQYNVPRKEVIFCGFYGNPKDVLITKSTFDYNTSSSRAKLLSTGRHK
jgi:hypothetical protein